ncbi:MAG TPA: 2Fe-2S iron-sulfur cluster binding domain-containing protein [Ramlibacter sp.]|jgi:ferredoxin
MQDRGAARAVYEAVLAPSGRRFAAPSDAPLLQSAEAAGIAVPSSCRNGTCRTCLRPLNAGQVRYAIPWPGLLPEEKAGGWVLPCVAYPLSDVVVGD